MGNLLNPEYVTKLCAACLLVFLPAASMAGVEFVVNGVEDPLRENILNHNDVIRLGRTERVPDKELEETLDNAIEHARDALKPYGYYRPEISGRTYRPSSDDAVVELNVVPGPPIVVRNVELEITGPGAKQRRIRSWRTGWPLTPGTTLNQVVWERQKQEGLDAAQAIGFLDAGYSTHRLELDLENNAASLHLTLETGPRYRFGEIDFGEHILQPGILEYIPRFGEGDPYSAELLDEFRLDLWRTGYFTDVNVEESRNADAKPPSVDLDVRLETDTRNSYQGALGYGTDTGIRLQTSWSRHPLSSRGDRVDVSAGWQEFNSEFVIRGTYRIPLRNRARQYWTADATISFENEDLELKRSDSDENFIKIANGDVDERHVKVGWLNVGYSDEGHKQRFVTPFVQYLNSERRYGLTLSAEVPQPLPEQPQFESLLRGIDNAFSVGVDYEVIDVTGQSFSMRGYHDRAWAFFSDSAIGSEVEFAQIYASTRRSFVLDDKWKFIFRAEAGYTDADVEDFSINVEGVPLELSVTELPNFYRFKAGGSQSVRGYSYEQLSNNNIGSNNIFTASAEAEFRFSDRWSGAVFADIGNAFNDWSEPELKLGIGVGIRWYSIAGPIRFDVAQARDFDDKPWRIHITIGTPLL